VKKIRRNIVLFRYLPNSDNWCDALLKQNPALNIYNFQHPQAELLKLNGNCHIAFNTLLSNKKFEDVSGDVILLFEADGDWNLNGCSSLLRKRYGESLFVDVMFVDGSSFSYWYDKEAIRKFKTKLGRSYMYYEKPRWQP